MPVENLEEEGLPNNPNLEISQWKFAICNPDGVNKEQAKKNIMVAVKEKGTFCCVIDSSDKICRTLFLVDSFLDICA